ncbi:MAG: ABC transporter ATP-binding protein/permease [bacterium]|nr:ABC transporter ATP-binding protein/permease [Clostridium sp.]MCM1539462.1 ABC transporter ATP-binding protein/permease [bacterium]
MRLIMRYCKRTIKRYPNVFLRATGLIMFLTLLNAFLPYGMRIFLDRVIAEAHYGYAALGILGFAVYLIFKTLVDIQWYRLLDELGGCCITDLSVELESALAETSGAQIDAQEPGRIKHTMYADVLDVFRVIGHHIPTLLGSVAVILASLVLAAFYDGKLMLFILAALILGTVLSFLGKKMIVSKAGNTNRKLKEHHMLCDQYVDSISLVQTNPVLPYFVDKTKTSIADFIATSQKEDGVQVFWTEVVSHYNTLFNLALSTLLALPAAGGSIVNLVFFITLSGIIMAEGEKSQLLIPQILRAQVSFENVDRLLFLPRRQGTEKLEQITEMEFADVHFSYRENEDEVLKHVSCVLRTGDNIRLAGGNGSGKSSFIKLLTGTYPPRAGQILVNGKPISTYARESLNEQILLIGQDELLLNEPFLTYLERIGGSAFDREKAEEALRFVALDQDDKPIENNGLSLSGGQRKKLLLSKLLLKCEKASVIILDEVEAGLDRTTVQKYVELLRGMFAEHGKIFLIVTHQMDDGLPFSRTFRFADGELMTE